MRSNVIERWLGLARIEIQTASGSAGSEMVLEGLLNFVAVRDFLIEPRARGLEVARGRPSRGGHRTARDPPGSRTEYPTWTPRLIPRFAFRVLERRVLDLLAVPTAPDPPEGPAESSRVFHAGRNYYLWSVLVRDLIVERLRQYRDSGLGDAQVRPPSSDQSEIAAARGLLEEASALRRALIPEASAPGER